MDAGGWDAVRQLLLVRSGGLCEARTPACLVAGDGLLTRAVTVSVQHRRARGMGGTSAPDVHELPNLLILCGDGTRGCHGWIETLERDAARLRGLWLPHDSIDPVRVCLELSSGRLVSLEGPFYTDRGWVLPGVGRPVILPATC